MFDTSMAEAAESLVTRIATIDGIGTVVCIEDDDESMRHPVVMPAAFVCLEKAVPGKKGTSPASIVNCDQVWAVVVRSRKLMGAEGCLPVIENVIDVITGFDPGAGIKPLKFQSVELYDKKYQSVAYIVRFSTVATATNR